MAYIDGTALSQAIGAATMLALFDDDNDGIADAAIVSAVCARADARADSWVAGNYAGPFPLTSSIPAMLSELSLAYAIAFAFERNPDYLRAFGMKPDQSENIKRADELGQRLREAVLRMPDVAAQRVPSNVGGAVVSDRVIVLEEGLGDF